MLRHSLRCQHETLTRTLSRPLSQVLAAARAFSRYWPRCHRPPGKIGRLICGLAQVGVHRRGVARVFLFVSMVW